MSARRSQARRAEQLGQPGRAAGAVACGAGRKRTKPPLKRAAFEFTAVAAASASASVQWPAAGNEQCWRQQLYRAAAVATTLKKRKRLGFV